MVMFQRSKTPLAEIGPDGEVQVRVGPRSAGDTLRQQREVLGLNLSDLAEALRIKPAYLAALEEGRPDRLPGPTYAAGFVRAYGDQLGLDGAEILRRFRLEATGLNAKPDLSFPMPLGERGVPDRSMLLLGLVLAICGYGAWYYLSIGERSRPERVTEIPAMLLALKPEKHAALPAPVAPTSTSTGRAGSPPSDPAIGSKMPVATDLAVPGVLPPPGAATIPPILAAGPAPVPGPEFTFAAAPRVLGTSGDAAAGSAHEASGETPRTYGAADGPTRIVLLATADSWIQVHAADHSVLFTGVLKPGESYRVPDRPGLSMRAGNAGGLDVTVDGKLAPPLGPIGTVRNVALDPRSLTAKSAIHN